jgi:GT2 family glycosyltransferase
VSEALLTVVVCTHQRPADLERCLDSLARLQTPVDVIVVDSASDPPCQSVVARFSDSLPGLVYHFEPVPGLSRARNAGMDLAKTELVAFVDDDVLVTPEWAERIVAPFADPAVACVGGTCAPAFATERPAWLSDRLLQYAGITRFRESREARSTSEYPFGANVAFRCAALRKIGGFSECLGRTGRTLLSGEEAVAIDALRAGGWRVWLEPDAVVFHTVTAERCTSRYYWRRLWWQGVTRARAAPSTLLTLRLLAALPIRLGLWILTRDRVHLFRAAETTGYVRELLPL